MTCCTYLLQRVDKIDYQYKVSDSRMIKLVFSEKRCIDLNFRVKVKYYWFEDSVAKIKKIGAPCSVTIDGN